MAKSLDELLGEMRNDAAFTEVVDKIMNGQCVLFTGSGFSYGANNVMDEALPLGDGLKNALERETGLQAMNLEQAAEDYLENLGEKSLVDFLRTHFSIKKGSEAHIEAAANKWKRIYTTNYDDLMEWAARQNKYVLTPVTPCDDVQECSAKSNLVIHINGSVHNLTPAALSDEVKLSERSYNQDTFRKSLWGRLFRFDLNDADAVFFIGYSLEHDLDLRRIVNESGMTRKIHFITAPDEPEARVRSLSRYGSVHPVGVDAFMKYVGERRRERRLIPVHLDRPLLCFRKHKLAPDRPFIKDADITSLLLQGNVSQAMVQYSYEEFNDPDYLYFIRRGEAMRQLDRLLNAGDKSIVVHSSLGNGKTLFLEAAKSYLVKKGYEVYEFVRYDFSLQREVERLLETDRDNVVIVVENYGHNTEVLETIACHRRNHVVLVSERSALHDLRYDTLEAACGCEFREIDVNLLGNDGRDMFIRLLDKTGLWGEYARLNYAKKDEYIRNDCRNSVRGVLMGVLRSPVILQRFSCILDTIRDKKDFYETVVLLMINNIFNLNLDLDMIETATDSAIYNNLRFRRNEVIKELVDFDNETLKIRSSILSEALLNNVIDKTIVKDVLVKTFKNFDKFRHHPDYRRLLKSLILYTGLRRVLDDKGPEKNYRKIMTSFFEQIRDTQFCHSNPHYWMQYAILKLDEGELDLAHQYFKTCYGLARNMRGYDTYQIDNHYARYLLERGRELEANEPYMDYFERAHKILTDAGHQKDTKYYPFKMAREYLPFYHAHAAHMTPEQKQRMVKASKEMLKMLDAYVLRVPDHRTNPNVTAAQNVLNQLLAIG